MNEKILIAKCWYYDFDKSEILQNRNVRTDAANIPDFLKTCGIENLEHVQFFHAGPSSPDKGDLIEAEPVSDIFHIDYKIVDFYDIADAGIREEIKPVLKNAPPNAVIAQSSLTGDYIVLENTGKILSRDGKVIWTRELGAPKNQRAFTY